MLFAYLCDGWVSSVKEFQSSKLFKTIQAPLTDQTKSILELIKYSFTSVDVLQLGMKRAQSAPKVSAGRRTEERLMSDKDRKEQLSGQQSDVIEVESEEEEATVADITPLSEEDLIDFVNFTWAPKIKDFTKRERLQPINHLLK